MYESLREELRDGLAAGFDWSGLPETCVYILVEFGEGLAEGLIGALDAADEHGALKVANNAVGYGAGV